MLSEYRVTDCLNYRNIVQIRLYLLLISILLSILLLLPLIASAQAVIIVNQTSPACTAGSAYYTTIQSAVDAAASGDTITVCSGTYNENVDITKSLTVKSFSQNPSDTIVQAVNTNDHVFDIKASWVNISGITAQNATGNVCAGFHSYVYSPKVVGLNITNIVAVNNYVGVVFMRGSNSILANSVLVNNSDKGVYLYFYATNNTITNNMISNNTIGIQISSDNTISNNSLKKNAIGINAHGNYNYIVNNDIEDCVRWAIYFYGNSNFITDNYVTNPGSEGIVLSVGLDASRYNTIKGNIVHNASYYGIYLDGSSDSLLIINNTISDNLVTNSTQSGIRIENAFNNNLTKNQLINNRYNGITLAESSDNTIEYNNISNREFLNEIPEGISLHKSNGTVLTGNTISYNAFGIYLTNSHNTTIINNTINESTNCGVIVSRSNGTLVYHNNFISTYRYQNYCDDDSNTWYGDYYKGGNYWSDWTSPDNLSGIYQNESGSDGIVDYPYNISGGINKDRYPFVKPYGWLDWGVKFSISSRTPRVNTTTIIPINFNTTIPVGGVQLYLLYNSYVINATNVTAGSASAGAIFSSKINNTEGKITIAVVSVAGISSGSIADIEFQVVGSVNSNTPLELVNEGVTDTKNIELNTILQNGDLTVISYPVGDVTGDDEITVADALMYLRFAVGEAVDNTNPLHDVTCDGKVTAADALLVLRKAVGQEVSLEC